MPQGILLNNGAQPLNMDSKRVSVPSTGVLDANNQDLNSQHAAATKMAVANGKIGVRQMSQTI